MFDFLKAKKPIDIYQAAEILKANPELLQEFENAYAANNISGEVSDNLFEVNAKQAAQLARDNAPETVPENMQAMVEKIVNELVAETPIWKYDGHKVNITEAIALPPAEDEITPDQLRAIPKEYRPQLTVNLMTRDIGQPSYLELLEVYRNYQNARTPHNKKAYYELFRRGLDILDLDAITYEMLGMNKNAMGYWLPRIVDAVDRQGFFKIPKTTIIKVPLSMLQLTRCEYTGLSPTTLDIVDKFCQKVFELDETKEYFIKTGTFSSKYDFRNAHVKGAKEVRELGEYLLFINYQASEMASPLCQPSFYGVSTTNEWVVREFIQDKENNPCIYNGMPLHTEYRVFVDFDEKTILGVNPYWDPEVMKTRFSKASDANTDKNKHDYVIYAMHEETLMGRYNDNVNNVVAKIHELIKDINLEGQWSMDVMQNGDDFYIIDMADAVNSALNHCVPKGKLIKNHEEWLPDIVTAKALPWTTE